jgi:hypothetical protein
MWLVIIFGIFIIMCGRCSPTYHLTKAMEKDPSLKLTDTVVTYKLLPGVKSRINYPLFAGSDLINIETPEGIKVRTVYTPSDTVHVIECPEDSIITIEVPKLVKVTLTDKELFKAAQMRLTDWQIARLSKAMLISLFVLGLILGFVVTLIL